VDVDPNVDVDVDIDTDKDTNLYKVWEHLRFYVLWAIKNVVHVEKNW
jgi:uncharacterized phage-associated protein